MFLLNSRSSLFTAASPSRKSEFFGLERHPFSRSYGARLPSSLTRVLPRALAEICLPTCVGLRYGHVTSNARGFSWRLVGRSSPQKTAAPIHPSGLMAPGFTWEPPYRLRPVQPLTGSDYPSASPHRFLRPSHGIGILTDFSITYAFRPRLRPGLPWADEPSPGNLGLTAARILALLFATYAVHSHFHPVQKSLRSSFSPDGTLPYRVEPKFDTRSFGTRLESRNIVGARPLDQ